MMIGSDAERLQQFIARDEKPRWWNFCGTLAFLFIATIVWMQTESYVKVIRSLGGGPTYEELRAHIAESKKIQFTLAHLKCSTR